MSQTPDVLLQLLERIHKEQLSAKAEQAKTQVAVTSLEQRLLTHINDEESMLERHTAEIIALQASFPNGDMQGHQMYHASIIKRNEWIAEVFKDAAKHIAKYGLLAFLCWLVWHGAEDLVKSLAKGFTRP